MTAVLLQSVKTGSSGWISLRRGNALKAIGIEVGDKLFAFFKPQGNPLSIVADGVFPLPVEAEHVRIEHTDAAYRSNGGGVSIDLVTAEI